MTKKKDEQRTGFHQYEPSKIFSSQEAFRKYMDSFKHAFKVDKKLNLVINLIISNIMSTLADSLGKLTRSGNIDRKDALVFLHLFADAQDKQSLGQLLDWSLNLTTLARECDIIPEGVHIIPSDEHNDDGSPCGLAVGVTDEVDPKEMEKLLATFNDDESWEVRHMKPSDQAEA